MKKYLETFLFCSVTGAVLAPGVCWIIGVTIDARLVTGLLVAALITALVVTGHEAIVDYQIEQDALFKNHKPGYRGQG